MGPEPLLETDPESFVLDLDSASNCPRSGSKLNFFLSFLNFLLIKVKIKRMLHINPSPYTTELNFKFLNLNFFSKSIFLSHFHIHRIRIRNSGSGSGFGRGSGPMQIRIHNTAQLYGIDLFSQSSSGYEFSFLPFRFLLQFQI